MPHQYIMHCGVAHFDLKHFFMPHQYIMHCESYLKVCILNNIDARYNNAQILSGAIIILFLDLIAVIVSTIIMFLMFLNTITIILIAAKTYFTVYLHMTIAVFNSPYQTTPSIILANTASFGIHWVEKSIHY